MHEEILTTLIYKNFLYAFDLYDIITKHVQKHVFFAVYIR